MKLQNLREFVVLSEVKNYTTAADVLYISQPTLSRHMKELEEELGVMLLDRSVRKIALTQYGLLLLPYAKAIVEQEDSFLSELTKLQDRLSKKISIGAIRQSELKVSEVISSYSVERKDVRFNAIMGESEDLLRSLSKGELDYVFIREAPPYSIDDYVRITLSYDPLCVILPANHPLAGKERIHISQLRHETFIMSEDTSLSYIKGTELAAQFGFELNVLFQGTKSQIMYLVGEGHGISLLFSDGLEVENTFVSIVEPVVHANINCVYNPKHATRNRDANFIHYLETHYASVSDPTDTE